MLTILKLPYRLLEKVVPLSYYQDDPDLMEYTAESIEAIITNEQEWFRVNHLMSELSPLLLVDLLINKNFTKKLIGDLWMINENTLVVPFKSLGQLALSEFNPEPSTIAMDINQTGMPIIFKDLD